MEDGVEDGGSLPEEASFDVQLYAYDLSRELADHFKKILKGKPLPCVWHTGLVAYGREYYFGASGIESCRPGETILGAPDQIVPLGRTELPYSLFLEYVFGLGETTYRPGSFRLLEHNSACFSGEVSQFLTGGPIPDEIRILPTDIAQNRSLSSALTEYFAKLSLKAEGSKGLSFGPLNGEQQRNGHAQPDEQPRRKKSSAAHAPEQQVSARSKKRSSPPMPVEESTAPANGAPTQPEQTEAQTESPATAAQGSTAPATAQEASDEGGAYTPRRSRRYEEPPITFPPVDGAGELRHLLEQLEGKLSPEEKRDLDDVMEYLTTEGGAWALGSNHLDTFARLLECCGEPCRVLRVLRGVCQKEDAILLLHQDRQRHSLMRHFRNIERLPPAVQQETAQLLCTLSGNASCLDWLTYISEWEDPSDGRPCSHCRCTTAAAVHALLSPATAAEGAALLYNLALKKELFEDMATELSMAVLQFLQTPPEEELMHQSLTSLLRFMCISHSEVPALVSMLGPDPGSFRGASARVDERVNEIEQKMRQAPAPR